MISERNTLSLFINQLLKISTNVFNLQCVKSVQILSFSWSVFSRIRTEYREIRSIQFECGKIRTRKNSVFGHFSGCVVLLIWIFMDFLKHLPNDHHWALKDSLKAAIILLQYRKTISRLEFIKLFWNFSPRKFLISIWFKVYFRAKYYSPKACRKIVLQILKLFRCSLNSGFSYFVDVNQKIMFWRNFKKCSWTQI